MMSITYLGAIGREIEVSEDYGAGIRWVFLEDDLKFSMRLFMNSSRIYTLELSIWFDIVQEYL